MALASNQAEARDGHATFERSAVKFSYLFAFNALLCGAASAVPLA